MRKTSASRGTRGSRAGRPRRGLVAAEREVVEAVLHRAVADRARVLPVHPCPREQPLEEEQALQVHVGVGERAREPSTCTTSTWASVVPMSFWMTSRAAGARRGRPQARVVELERRRAVQPAHERRDERGPAGPARRPRRRRASRPRRRAAAVERLVHVHDEQVRAVAAVRAARASACRWLLPGSVRPATAVPVRQHARRALPDRRSLVRVSSSSPARIASHHDGDVAAAGCP